MKTHPAFAGAGAGVVVHPIPFKVRDGAVVEFDGDIDDERPLWPFQGFDPFGQAPEVRRDAFDLLDIRPPWPQFLGVQVRGKRMRAMRSEEHTSELQSLMRISYAVFCLKKKKNKKH